jgi:DNA-binding CsgD family transcriptional regulator
LRVSRSKGAREFSQQDKALVAGLLPHLERAIRIHSKFNRIESERALYAGAIAHLSVATIILDEIGQVMNLNETAQKLLNHENGLWLERGRLCLQSDSETQALQAAIDNSLAKQKAAEPCVVEAFRVRRNNNEPDLGVIIRPVPVTEWSEGAEVPTLAVFISDPSQQAEAPVQVITQLFGLTPAEANLSMLLANGLTLEEAAVELGISRNTARTHLRSVFGKTGVSRQTLLVRLILKSVAPLAVAEG